MFKPYWINGDQATSSRPSVHPALKTLQQHMSHISTILHTRMASGSPSELLYNKNYNYPITTYSYYLIRNVWQDSINVC